MITLLTDFGTADYFVAAMKGVIQRMCPAVPIVDLTHEIPAQDLYAGAFTLAAASERFPAGTIHLAVVDPGVGSARRPIIAQVGDQSFVGPDNGLFSFVYAQAERAQLPCRIYHANQPAFFLPEPRATFHGRDVFAPLAAWLARGVHPASMGVLIEDAVRLSMPVPQWDGSTQSWHGEVIHVDRFGNCITNLTAKDIETPVCFEFGKHTVTQIGTHYAQAAEREKLFAYVGSAGYWEIGLWCDSAAARFAIQRGAEVVIRTSRHGVPIVEF